MQHYFPLIIALSLAFCQDAFAQIIATYKETYRPHLNFAPAIDWCTTRAQSPMLSTLLASLTAVRSARAIGTACPRLRNALTSKFDAYSIVHTMIALFYGSVLQKLWKPDIDSDAQFAVFEHFLRSLELE